MATVCSSVGALHAAVRLVPHRGQDLCIAKKSRRARRDGRCPSAAQTNSKDNQSVYDDSRCTISTTFYCFRFVLCCLLLLLLLLLLLYGNVLHLTIAKRPRRTARSYDYETVA